MGMPLPAVWLFLCMAACAFAPTALAAEGACTNEALRLEQSASRLPDCRAYELVTPPYKEGTPVQGLQGEFALAPDGTRLIATSLGVFAGSEEGELNASSRLNGTAYELSRTASGWQPAALGPPESRFEDAGMYDASADLQSTLWGLGELGQTEGFSDFYIEQPRGTFTEVGPPTPEPSHVNAGKYSYLGASADLSHVLFSTEAGYRWPFDQTSASASSSLYEYVGTGNSEPSLVGVSGAAGSTELVSQCGTLLGSSDPDTAGGSMYNAVSATGARVFFTAVGQDEDECGGSQPPVDELLAREEEPGGQARTVVISEPSLAYCSSSPSPPCADAHFEGASQDGSKVFFSSTQKLLPEADEGTLNLYEYDFQAQGGENLALVSAGGAPAQVQGVARVSEDGSHVYFVAKGVLSATANSAGANAIAGAENLYLYEHDAQFPAGRTSFLATLSSSDGADWAQADDRPVLASQNGRYLVFTSQADLLGEGTAPGVKQVFQYDAQSGILVRVSIGQEGYNEDGRRPLYDAQLATQQADAFDSPTSAVGMSAPENGAVFFASANALTPQALDNQTDTLGEPVPSIYEYRTGSVRLISDGHDNSGLDGGPGVQLLGSDPSGGDVFFATVDPLLEQDSDTQQDIYDARTEGGFAAPKPAPGCFGEMCQGPLSPAPPLTGAAGSTPSSGRAGHATSGSATGPFGITDFEMQAQSATNETGTQAGGHPRGLTTSFDFTSTEQGGGGGVLRPTEDVKNVLLSLPVGLAVNALAAPRCTLAQLQLTAQQSSCPASSRIGTLGLQLSGDKAGQLEAETVPVYNMVPEAGYPLEFGAIYRGRRILMYGSILRTGSGYGLRLAVPGVSGPGIIGVSLTLFGEPELEDGEPEVAMPMLTNPVDCAAGPLSARLAVDTWQHPGLYQADEAVTYPYVSGCDALRFEPMLDVAPEVTQADEPSGYELRIRVPQVESRGIPVTPELKQATVTLPPGVSLSPAAADGLVGCAATGGEGINLGSGEVGPTGQDLGDSEATELGADGLFHAAPGHCPAASTVGVVEIDTPLLDEPLEGHIYLARPGCGFTAQPACTETDAADGNLVGLYLEAVGSGVILKLAGHVELQPTTGQLTLSFDELPQLPISDLKMSLKGGPRALLANPQMCGSATTTSDLSPWSSPLTPDALPVAAFPVNWDGAGGACPSTLPFEVFLGAGVATPAAGSFTTLTLRVSRSDREQDLSRIGVRLPPELQWMFLSVPLCMEPQAASASCLPASKIGSTQIAIGVGPHPFWLSGSVYLTGGYRGAPFGLSIAVPMVAGPFNLGLVVVRAAIAVDPSTGALTISGDPLPQVIDGVPLRIQTVELSIDRPEFVLNPTFCASRQITATIEGTQGASTEASNPFVTAGCESPPPAPSGQAGPAPAQAGVGKAAKPKQAVKHKHKRKKHKRGKKHKKKPPKHRLKHGSGSKKGKHARRVTHKR